MPYKTDKLRLPEEKDRRRKLTDADKESIRVLYAAGRGSHQALADLYGVSKSLIGIIVNPDRAARVSKRTAEHWAEYYDREQHTKAIREHRRYKHRVLGERREAVDV